MTRVELRDYIFRTLGCPSVKVELTDTQVDDAINDAIQRYREFGADGTRRSVYILNVLKDTSSYTLPIDIHSVISVVSQSSARALTTNIVDPYLNIFGPAHEGISLVEIGTGYLDEAMRMFNHIYEFYETRNAAGVVTIEFPQVIRSPLEIGLMVEKYLDTEEDLVSHQWIRDYSYARSKWTLGEVREKFESLAGPGGPTLNGGKLKAEAMGEISYLDDRLKTYHKRPVLITG